MWQCATGRPRRGLIVPAYSGAGFPSSAPVSLSSAPQCTCKVDDVIGVMVIMIAMVLVMVIVAVTLFPSVWCLHMTHRMIRRTIAAPN